jgi:hypothetical protein
MTPVKRIYFMRQIGSVGPIKIGRSRWPANRLRELSLWSPVPLEIIHVEAGDHLLERAVHRHLVNSLSHLEWFHATQETLLLIERLKLGIRLEEAIGYSLRVTRRRDRRFGMRPHILAAARPTDIPRPSKSEAAA